MKRRSIVKIAVLVIGVPILLLAIVLLYLNFADLSGWRNTVARLASDAIGRELRISGEFQPEIGFTTRVIATDITLANAGWSNDPQMVSVDRVAGEIDLLSIFFGPITIGDAEIDGARVLFEVDGDGRFNWALGDGKPSESDGGEFEMVIGHALVNDLQLVYAGPDRRPLEAELSKLEITDDGTGMLDLDLAGSLDGSAVAISGRLGTFIGLINANRVEHDLEGRFADTEFGLRGKIGELGSLAGVEGGVTVSGPELSHITDHFGLNPIIEGPFNVEASVRPSGEGSGFDLEAAAGGISAKVAGVADSLTNPSSVDATMTASGPSIRTVGAFTGVADLPDEEFSISGGVRWEGFPVTFNQVEITVGDNTLSADGVLGGPPQMLGTDFTVRGEGLNVSSIGALAGIDLPRDHFSISGRVVRVEGGLQVDAVEAQVGRTILRVDGKVGDPPDYADTTLAIHAEGPNIAHFEDLIGIELPSESFVIDGRLAEGDEAIALQDVNARLGRTTLRADGQLTTEPGLVGSDLRLSVSGTDASQVAVFADVSGVPSEPFSLEGRIRVLEKGYRVHDLAATLGSLAAKADGFIAPPPTLYGTDLQIHIEDTDLSHPASMAGLLGFPRDTFAVESRVRIEEPGYRLDGFHATVGDMALEIDGLIGVPPELDGTQVHLTAQGPRLASLNPYVDQTGLPAVPFSVSGNARVTSGTYVLDDVVAEIDGNRITVNGTVQPVSGLLGTDLEVEVSAPDLRQAGRLAVGFADLPGLPAEPSTLTTRLAIDATGYQVENFRLTLARAEVAIGGRVGRPPSFVGTDLTIDGDGPDASLFKALTGVTIPVAPFQINGRVERNEAGFRFHDVTARLGEYRAAINGSLGELPKLIGTDLEIHASGPDTGLIRELAGLPNFPDQPFELDGKLNGTPERFAARDFSLIFGLSDVEGSFTVDITGKPDVHARLKSTHLDLRRLREHLAKKDAGTEDAAKSSAPVKGKRLISDEPLDLAILKRANAEISVRVDDIVLPLNRLYDVGIDVRLDDGRLEIKRITAAGIDQGSASGSLILEPDGQAYRLNTQLKMRQIRLDLPGTAVDPASQPPVDINIDIETQGATPHALASSSNGSIQVVIGKGMLDNRALDLVTADILLTLLRAFNPFAKEDVATELQCAVILVSFENGLARFEPMAMQSDKMTMLGKGKIDLGTENLDFDWVTKPRKGIGISASMLTNPYIKIGGTLADPAVELKPLEALTSTGVAVATMGISLVAKGMLDRVTAEKKVCKKALEEIESLSHGSYK